MQAEELVLPRRPTRANGVARYNQLLKAAEAVVESEGADALTIQSIAAQARVPMASVYHFFPNPAAACIAIAESHLDNFAVLLAKPVRKSSSQTFRSFIATIMKRIVDYYNANPAALKLMLGSDHSWRIRRADLANNLRLATAAAQALHQQYGLKHTAELQKKLMITVTICESIWSLSVADKGRITKGYADELLTIVTNYLQDALNIEKA